jgi:23S rRNA (cytidine1920-2'-O)/16S rRNA (cytidine1409-2'-O)-methyltransferase
LARNRIDTLLVERHLAESREKARILIMAGSVYAAGQRVDKPDKKIESQVPIEIKGPGLPYVGFGGIKMEEALSTFDIDPSGKTVVDIGASTGGFVDCLLQKGASHVYAVDVGKHQLHEKLRTDGRVTVLDQINARYLKPEDIGEEADIVTIDVSFISLKKILPAAIPVLKPTGLLLTLLKPQFEVGRWDVGKGGIVRDQEKVAGAISDMQDFGRSLGLTPKAIVEVPREKEKKNREYFILWVR